MRVIRWAAVGTIAFAVATAVVAAQDPARGRGGQAPGGAGGGQRGGGGAPPMTLTTTAFTDGGTIPAKYTQAGDQTSPALTWTNTPPGTVTLVLHMHDLEVARNRTTDDQLHWLVWNIDGTRPATPVAGQAGAAMCT